MLRLRSGAAEDSLDLTSISIRHPAAAAVGVALVIVFGALAIVGLPIQLLPDLERPQIQIFNNWREAAPEEMEANIIEPQERVLRNTPGVEEMSSNIGRGFGSITLTFDVETDMQQALIDVVNNLNRAPPRPVDAENPFVAAGAGFNAPTTASLLIRPLPDNPNKNLYSEVYQRVIEDVVEPRLSRISGVSQVNLQSRRERQVQITFDPFRTAALGLSIGDAARAIGRANDSSGGFASVGRRRYTVRYAGQFEVDDLGRMIVGWSEGRPVQLRELAEVEVGLDETRGFIRRNGYPAYYITVQRTPDSNTVDVLDEINVALRELNEGPLAELALTMDLSFDASVHIRRALRLVQNNLGLGVLLALAVLWYLLRDMRAILLIGLSIPISLLVAFVALKALGLTLNVISLAGLAFAVGLVVDAAIIVQENIVRYRHGGDSPQAAATRGPAQVSGALLASTVTTVAIFVPVLFMPGMAGQMFSDLAFTLSVAVLASFICAMTILPVASARWLTSSSTSDPKAHWWDLTTRVVMRLTSTRVLRWAWIVVLLGSSVAVTVYFAPKADFLPSAKSDGIQCFFNVAPGTTVDVFEREIGDEIVERLRPHMEHNKEPWILGYNLSMFDNFNILYLYPWDPGQIDDFIALLRDELLVGLPDTPAYVSRASLLGIGFSGGRTINVDLQGSDIRGLMRAAEEGQRIVQELIPGAVVRPVPGLSLAEPELRLVPVEINMTSAGLDHFSLAQAVRAMTGGLFVGEYFDGNDRFDVILRAGQWTTPEELAAMPLHTPLGGIQTVGALTEVQRTVGPTQLLREDGQRTVSLQVLPPETTTVEEALGILRQQAAPRIRAFLPEGAAIRHRGSADRLEAALDDMGQNFLLAVFILFLLMAAMFRSVYDSLLVLLVMPLAMAGGIGALRLLNLVTYQSLDLLTMIGFIILLGLVVNNAILLVAQTRDGQAEGLSLARAVEDAVRVRARPIYLSTLTSIFGMLPLALVPGTGSDVYRGLATVIVGGMVVSATFTLVLMPCLLRVGDGRGKTWTPRGRLSASDGDAVEENR